MTLVKRAQAKAPETSRTRNRPSPVPHAPAAGAHAARHLTNEDATPGAGALTSVADTSLRYVDGGAG